MLYSHDSVLLTIVHVYKLHLLIYSWSEIDWDGMGMFEERMTMLVKKCMQYEVEDVEVGV